MSIELDGAKPKWARFEPDFDASVGLTMQGRSNRNPMDATVPRGQQPIPKQVREHAVAQTGRPGLLSFRPVPGRVDKPAPPG